MKPWPHQERVHIQCQHLWKSGCKRWVVTAPCGAGKSVMMSRIILPAVENGYRVALYSPRIQLTAQFIEQFTQIGVRFGVVSSSFKRYEDHDAAFQLCSIQTVAARMKKAGSWFPDAEIVVVDEAHQMTAGMAEKVFKRYDDMGATRIGFTATPVDLGEHYDKIVSSTKYADLLECNAHLPVECYGPDRPDLSSLRTDRSGEFSYSDNIRINEPKAIVGRVFEHWQKLNPHQLPAIGFAPGVQESKAFVYQFMARGIPCAHIDGERTVLVRESEHGGLQSYEYETNEDTRQEVIRGSKEGRYKVVWNRFLLREAIDMPWLYHCIVATSMGGLSTYLQSVGRVLRYYNGYDKVIVQDHGGNIDRHGFPNEERSWELGCTNRSLQKAEKERRQRTEGDEAEPICCPKCNGYRTHGSQCPHCGHIHRRSVRMVRETDGTLVRKIGRVVKHKKVRNFESIVRSCLYAGYTKGMTVKQAYHLAKVRAKKHGVRLTEVSHLLPPTGHANWHRSVRDVYPMFRPKHVKDNSQGGVFW